jgi:UDP:flavonoid glycosyltransferase YjiC (YdhE family)
MPDHPIVSLLGVELAERYFPRALPHVFEHFARPLNRVRRRHRLPPIGSLPEVLTHGDLTLFPDVPELVPTRGLPPHQTYLGPVLWQPAVPLPPWWRRLDPQRPTAYVTLGSSGRPGLLPRVLEGLTAAGVQSLVSTAGRDVPALPPHAHAAPYLPGALAARRADFVVSNGGSSTGYQALAEGRPVLGIPSNLDQYLATDAITTAGAGVPVRAGTLTAQDVTQAARRLLAEPAHAAAAARIAAAFERWDACARFEGLVARATAAARATA